jgi:hypothetical protein
VAKIAVIAQSIAEPAQGIPASMNIPDDVITFVHNAD